MTVSFYRGYGGSITVGRDADGRVWGKAAAGVGLGSGVSVRPSASFPSSEEGAAGPAAYVGTSIGAEFRAGPVGGEIKAEKGIVFEKDQDGAISSEVVENVPKVGEKIKPDGAGVKAEVRFNIVEIGVKP